MTMTPAELHARAQRVFADVLASVTDADLDRPTPCPDWSVGALIDHVVAGNCRVIALTGGSPPELPDDRVAAHAVAGAGAQSVFDAPGAMAQPFELPIGTVPGAVFVAIRSGDLYAHAWDLATAIGGDTDLDHEVGAAVHAATAPLLVPALRGPGRPFGEEQSCPPGRPVADRYAAFVGRAVS